MLDISVRAKREELRQKSVGLRETCLDINDFIKAQEIIMQQDEIYKQWDFYNNIIKNIERVNYEMQDKKNR